MTHVVRYHHCPSSPDDAAAIHGDLPQAFLEKLYVAITTNEIKIKEQDAAAPPMRDRSLTVSASHRKSLFQNESAAMVKESQEAFKTKAKRKSVYFSSRNADHLRPMFESTWCAVLLMSQWTT